MTCLVTNEFILLPTVPQGSYWASGDGVPVKNHPPPGGNTLRAPGFLCFLVPGSSWALRAFLVRWRGENLIDFLL